MILTQEEGTTMEYMVLWGKGRGTIVEGTKIGDGGGKRKRRDTYVTWGLYKITAGPRPPAPVH